MSQQDRVHVMPNWEPHESSADCWCEPRVEEDGNLVIHDAKACPDGRPHSWFNGECMACGATERK